MILSIVTLNYKKKDLTATCIDSLHKQYAQQIANNELEILVVDNASGDDSVPYLKDFVKNNKYKNTHIIAHTENAGFGKGCNIGARASKGNYLLFLNNDTLVKDSGLWDMVEYLNEHQEVSILGGQLTNSDGTLQSSAGKFYTLGNAFLLLLGFQKYGILDISPHEISRVDWVKGALLMIRSQVFRKLGGFDENIFMYTEDMELCYRAKLAGYAVYFYPQIKVEHIDQGSSNRTFAIINIYKNLLYFYKKHRSKNEYRILKMMLRAKALTLIQVGKLTKNEYLTHTYEEALKVT